MKKSIFLIALAVSNISSAQHAYIPIPTDSTFWLTQYEDWHEGDIPPSPHTYSYQLGQFDGVDTIINSKIYSSYYGDIQSGFIPVAYGQHPALYGQWIRQDSMSKKIWYVRNQSHPDKEELLYDFSLQTGDTITDTNSSYFNPNVLYPYKAWIDQIDSVLWSDGNWHYRWWIKSDYGPAFNHAHTIQVEGMGYINNFLDDPFLEFHPLIAYTKSIICFKVKSNWLYEQPNHWIADCDSLITKNVLNTSEIRTAELSMPMLYPNPVPNNGTLFLNSYAENPQIDCLISIFNSMGEKVLSVCQKPGTEIKLDQYRLGKGLYFFIVGNGKRRIFCEKVLLE